MLAGLTLAVKDVFHIAGLPTSAGNPAWLATHPVPKHTSDTVSQLVDHGATVVGKTHTDELAYSLNGCNIHYGIPQNPIAPERIPGGSSSGSAVAVASGMADIGLGTDTGGSIRVPASYNGLYGLRPTQGAVKDRYMVPLAQGFDTIGWMTRDIDTLKRVSDILLPELATPAVSSISVLGDLLPLALHGRSISDWTVSLGKDFSVQTGLFSEQDLIDAADTFRILQGAQIWQQHGDWVSEHLEDFAPDIAARFAMCQALTPTEIREATVRQRVWLERINDVLEQFGVLIVPTTPGPAPLIATNAEDLADYRKKLLGFTAMAGLAGLPQLHIPLGNYDNAPVGISLIGKQHSDWHLLQIAGSLLEKY